MLMDSGVVAVKRVVGVLTASLIACVAIAGHWAAENAALKAELRQLKAQSATGGYSGDSIRYRGGASGLTAVDL